MLLLKSALHPRRHGAARAGRPGRAARQGGQGRAASAGLARRRHYRGGRARWTGDREAIQTYMNTAHLTAQEIHSLAASADIWTGITARLALCDLHCATLTVRLALCDLHCATLTVRLSLCDSHCATCPAAQANDVLQFFYGTSSNMLAANKRATVTMGFWTNSTGWSVKVTVTGQSAIVACGDRRDAGLQPAYEHHGSLREEHAHCRRAIVGGSAAVSTNTRFPGPAAADATKSPGAVISLYILESMPVSRH